MCFYSGKNFYMYFFIIIDREEKAVGKKYEKYLKCTQLPYIPYHITVLYT